MSYTSAHRATLDYVAGDRLDMDAWAAFCNVPDCLWRGPWHHADADDPDDPDSVEDARALAEAAAEEDAHLHAIATRDA